MRSKNLLYAIFTPFPSCKCANKHKFSSIEFNFIATQLQRLVPKSLLVPVGHRANKSAKRPVKTSSVKFGNLYIDCQKLSENVSSSSASLGLPFASHIGDNSSFAGTPPPHAMLLILCPANQAHCRSWVVTTQLHKYELISSNFTWLYLYPYIRHHEQSSCMC